jgi:hypothetical protein
MSEARILGISPWSNPNYDLMQAAGIRWLRLEFNFPWADRVGGEYTARHLAELDQARRLHAQGFRLMGITPLAGSMAFDRADGITAWRPRVPAWAGSPEAGSYYDAYEQACQLLGRETAGIVELWQVSNEMDIDTFRGPLTPEQAARFMEAGARGLKAGNPACRAGINPAGLGEWGRWLFRRIYSAPDCPFEYAGIDGYYGSWAPGAPEDWIPTIEEIRQLTGRPVLVNEWGYGSLGGPAAPTEAANLSVCDAHAFHYVWRAGHTPEEQADYLRIGLKILATYPDVLGGFIYNWGDDAACYHCGRTDCPAECGWGLVDSAGQPKPSYHAVRETAHQFYR